MERAESGTLLTAKLPNSHAVSVTTPAQRDWQLIPAVQLSPDPSHRLVLRSLYQSQLHIDPRDALTVTKDGWIKGPGDELVLYVPAEYRLGFWWPRTVAILGVKPVGVDLSNCAHGETWTECYVGEGDDAENIDIRFPSSTHAQS